MKYITTFKEWYELREMREKLLIVLCSWAALYAIFSVFLFHSQNYEKKQLFDSIRKVNNDISSWKKQLTALEQIPDTALYREWKKNNRSLSELEKKYKTLLQTTPASQIQNVIKTFLTPNPNITLIQITNTPEKPYASTHSTNTADDKFINSIFEQQLIVTVYGQFFDLVNYLEQLEKALPNLYWDTLDYEVMQYPFAKVQLEMSILYEKKK